MEKNRNLQKIILKIQHGQGNLCVDKQLRTENQGLSIVQGTSQMRLYIDRSKVKVSSKKRRKALGGEVEPAKQRHVQGEVCVSQEEARPRITWEEDSQQLETIRSCRRNFTLLTSDKDT